MRVSRYEQDRERIKEALQEGGIARAIEITGYSSSVISHCISRLGLVDTLKEYRRVNGLCEKYRDRKEEIAKRIVTGKQIGRAHV